MVTTTQTADYLGRALINETPGSSDATDFAGRDVAAGDVDYMGRDLTSTILPVQPDWAVSTEYAIGDRVTLTSGEVLEASVAGTSDEVTEPTAPAVGADVVDGTVTWVRLA